MLLGTWFLESSTPHEGQYGLTLVESGVKMTPAKSSLLLANNRNSLLTLPLYQNMSSLADKGLYAI
jgi:hypothetical protein